jgi:O-acetylhomoserine (thiol)-lyase
MNFNTALLHAGVDKKEKFGSTLSPIYQTSAFFQSSAEDLAGIFENKVPGFCYTRVANPTISTFENRITKLEGGIGSVAAASGMAAIFNALTNILESGDEIVSSSSLYGGTIDLFRDLEAFGIKTNYVCNNDFEQFENAINEHTKLIFAETIGNPCLDVTDVDGLAEVAHRHGIPLIIDNTVASPYLVKVLEHGADIVINSTSKYINGSSNAIGGILTDKGKFKWTAEKFPVLKDYLKLGPFAYLARLRAGLYRNAGACMTPQTAYLNQIGLETLGLRMERQCMNAALLAQHLEDKYPDVIVNYPGLKSSKWHEIGKKLLKGGYGAIVTIRVGSKERAFQLLNELQLAYRLSNIGDTKTLVLHPASTISLHSTEKQKEDAGVFDDLIRISVGIEDIEDLKEDFDKAFEKLNAGGN